MYSYSASVGLVLYFFVTVPIHCMRDEQQNVEGVEGLPRLSYTLDIGARHKAWVFDDLVSMDYNQNLLTLLGLPGALGRVKNPFENYTLKNPELESVAGQTRWLIGQETAEFESYKIWKVAKPLIQDALSENVHLKSVRTEFLKSLDFKPPVIDENCNENHYNVMFFIIPFWQYNNYGQLSLYTKMEVPSGSKESRLEVAHTIYPKPCRMVVWPSCVPYIAHPPTVNFFRYLQTFTLILSTEETDYNEPKSPFKGKFINWYSSFKNFKFANDDANRIIEHTEHFKRSFFDSATNGIYVYDDLFTADELGQIKQFLMESGKIRVGKFFLGASEDGDNVDAISMYNVSEFAGTALWKRVYDLVCHVSGKNEWYPYDIALNHIHTTGHSRIHEDAENYEFEYTFLLYLNKDIGVNEFGETVWFEAVPQSKSDQIQEFTHPGGEEYEAFAAVKPKYGRVVLFRNFISHSARPMGSQHIGNRYSFAVKISESKKISIMKQIYELSETLSPVLHESINNFFDSRHHSTVQTERFEHMLQMLHSKQREGIRENMGSVAELL